MESESSFDQSLVSVEIEAVLPADDDVQSVYQYLIGAVAPGSA